jgi:hypothetical protein
MDPTVFLKAVVVANCSLEGHLSRYYLSLWSLDCLTFFFSLLFFHQCWSGLGWWVYLINSYIFLTTIISLTYSNIRNIQEAELMQQQQQEQESFTNIEDVLKLHVVTDSALQ